MKSKKKFVIKLERNDNLNRTLSGLEISIEGKNFIDAIRTIFNNKKFLNYSSRSESLIFSINKIDNSNQLYLFPGR